MSKKPARKDRATRLIEATEPLVRLGVSREDLEVFAWTFASVVQQGDGLGGAGVNAVFDNLYKEHETNG